MRPGTGTSHSPEVNANVRSKLDESLTRTQQPRPASKARVEGSPRSFPPTLIRPAGALAAAVAPAPVFPCAEKDETFMHRQLTLAVALNEPVKFDPPPPHAPPVTKALKF